MKKKNKPQMVCHIIQNNIVYLNKDCGHFGYYANKFTKKEEKSFDKYLEDELKSDPTLEKELERFDKEIDEEVEAYNKHKKLRIAELPHHKGVVQSVLTRNDVSKSSE